MSTEVYFENIQKYLFQYSDLIENSNALGLTNKTVNAENIFRLLLNKAFGWNLKNANALIVNQVGFDLYDEKLRIYVQVTSNKDRAAKRKNTVSSFISKYGNKTEWHFIILFITKKCSTAILKEQVNGNLRYEGYDINKLVQKIYYDNPDPHQLESINKLLQKVVNPVLLKFDKSKKTHRKPLPNQTTPPLEEELYIPRSELIKALFEFSQEASGLLIGGHGYGKSFTLEQLQRFCQKQDIPCFIIRINELAEGTDQEIGRELKAPGSWLNSFLKFPVEDFTGKGILIFDAFDTAKDGKLKQAILNQIRKAISTLKSKWNILVSVRSFDASKSPQLMEMFPTSNIRNSIPCRHIEIPKLSDTELMSAVNSDEKIAVVYQKATDGLKQLLAIPYFFTLLARLLKTEEKLKISEIAHIETEEQLLSLYWRTKVGETTAKDIFLQKLTTSLSQNENLSIDKSDILTESNSVLFDELSSIGVIVESSITGRRMAYAHNILLDFAISKYLIPEDGEALLEFIKVNERMPFIFRQGFIYFYCKLWQNDPTLFWQHYAKIAEENSALFRLFHQTILNYVVCDFYKKPEDLLPFFNKLETDKKGQSLRRLLEAIRFITKGDLRDKDYNLLVDISQDMHWSFLWEMGLLINGAVIKLQKKDDRDINTWSLLSKIANNYWKYVLESRKAIHQYNKLIENNGGRWGIENICAVYFCNKSLFGELILETLELLKEENFPIRPFLDLSNNIVRLFETDKIFALDIYKALYYHNETSNEETIFGSSVFPMRSNRRQDFLSLQHNLEAEYPKLLEIAPVPVMKMGLEIVNKFCENSYTDYKNEVYPLIVKGINTYFVLNIHYYDIADDEKYEPISHASNIFKLVFKLGDAGDCNLLDSLILTFIEHAHTANLWRKFLQFIIQFPKCMAEVGASLLQNRTIFMCYDTTQEAGAVLTAIWPYLSIAQKEEIEKVVLGVKDENVEELDINYQTERVSRLLNCIPAGEAVLQKSKDFISTHARVENRPKLRVSTAATVYDPTIEDRMMRAGLIPGNSEDIAIYNKIKQIEEFATRPNHEKKKITFKDCEAILPDLRLLFEEAKRGEWRNDQIRATYDYTISRAVKTISEVGKLNKSIRIFVQEVALFYINQSLYIPDKYETGEENSKNRTYSHGPRIEAVEAGVNLLYNNKSAELVPIVLSLIRDKSSLTRYHALHSLIWFWRNKRQSFWGMIIERAGVERENMCLNQIVKMLSYTDVMADNVVETEKAASILLNTLLTVTNVRENHLWAAYNVLLMRLLIRHDSKQAEMLIIDNLGNTMLCRQLIIDIIRVVDPHEVGNNYIKEPDKYAGLFRLVEKILDYRFNAIIQKGLESDNLKEDFEIIDRCVQELFFVITKGRGNNGGKDVTPENNKAFYNTIKPILNKIVNRSGTINSGFMVAHTGYYFLQLLNYSFGFDEEHVLSLAFKIVNCAAANSFAYDQSTLGEIVKLSEKVLTDHKYLLKKRENFNNLLVILDQFANSGWQEALELTWRLKEAF